MRKVESTDATFLYLENENTHSHGTFIWFYEPDSDSNEKVSYDDMLRYVESKLDVADLFRQKLAQVPFKLDFPYWVTDENFNLEYHIRSLKLPEPGGWQGLFAEVSRIHSVPMNLDRPLWEMYVINGLGDIDGLPDGAFAVLAKFHHVAMDGATGMTIIEGFHDKQPGWNPALLPVSSEQKIETMPNLVTTLAIAGFSGIKHTLKGIQLGIELVKRLPKILSTVRLSELFNGSGAPETLFNTDVSRERVVDCKFLKLEEIKQLRKAVPGATVNDVLLSICGGALRRYLESKDALPDASMMVACPINVRTQDETETGGNRITTMFTSVHTEIADPVKRLRAVHLSSKKAKRTIEAIGARNLMELSNALPSPTLALLTTVMDKASGLLKGPSLFNCPVSNLPGPRKPLYLGGARLLHIGCAMPVMDGFGLFVGICTYQNELSFTITSSKNILPDPSLLTMQFEHAFNELKTAVEQPAKSRKQGAKKRLAKTGKGK